MRAFHFTYKYNISTDSCQYVKKYIFVRCVFSILVSKLTSFRLYCIFIVDARFFYCSNNFGFACNHISDSWANNIKSRKDNFSAKVKSKKTLDKKFALFIKILKNWNSLNQTKSAQETVSELIWNFDDDVWNKVWKYNVKLFPEADVPIELLNDYLVWILESKLSKSRKGTWQIV